MTNPYDWQEYGYKKSPFRLPTERASAVDMNAVIEAARAQNSAVEPEHLLLSLTHIPDSMAARILQQLGIELVAIRAAVERKVSRSNSRANKTDAAMDRLMSHALKRVIDYA